MQTSKFEAIICKDYDELLGLTQKWKSEGLRVVFTNGCFDILHAGHVDYLQKSAAAGDKLIVGLNDDASVRQLKGKTRPHNPIERRLKVLASLRCVDAIVVFQEETPQKLISTILPDILVKGGDYEGKKVVGSEIVEKNGGKVVLIDFVYNISTTKILEIMKKGSS